MTALDGAPCNTEEAIERYLLASKPAPCSRHDDLEALRHRVQKIIADGTTGAQRQLLHALVH